MGLFSWWKARNAEHKARIASAQRISQLLETQIADDMDGDEWQAILEKNAMGPAKRHLRENVSDGNTVIVNTKAEGMGWEIIGSAYKGHIGHDQQVMIAQARRFFRFDPNAQAAIFAIVSYLLGRGVKVTPKTMDKRHWKLWRNFWTDPGNKMDIRQFEIVKRLFRDGEVILRFFNKTAAGEKTPFIQVRFMDPIDLRRGANEANDTTDKTSQGIVFDPEDIETPLKYYFRERNNPQKEEVVDAAEIMHIKFPTSDMDQTRGESALQSVMDLFTHYKQWLKNRIILNKLRTAIFAVREIDMQSGAQVSTLAQSLPTSGRASDGESKKQNIRPGTLYTPPPGVKLRMESPNINASDVKEDGRNMILQMSAGTGLPEYMFGDASNANYSSTMMAESPFVKRIHYFQSYLEATLWKPLYRRVIQAAVDAQKMQAPAEEDIFGEANQPRVINEDAKDGDPTPDEINDTGDDEGQEDATPDSESELEIFYGCDVQWPEVIHRDPKEQTEALVLARNEGWVSDPTCAEKLGFDYDEEVRKQKQIEEQAEEDGNPLLQHDAGSLDAHQEEQDALDQQNKELAAAGGKKPFGKSGAGA